MIGFINDHRAGYGVEPICHVLPIAPSTFQKHLAITREPDRASDRAKKAKVVHRPGPWKTADAVEREILKWVDWFYNRRRLQPTGNIPSAQAEVKFHEPCIDCDQVAYNGLISLR